MGARVEWISSFTHLRGEDLAPPASPAVFFDPADTEVGAWVGVDLLLPGCTILDLASGSGAAAAAFVRAGAGHAHGVDISSESVNYAKRMYASDIPGARVSLAQADFVTLSSEAILQGCPGMARPRVVVSNPAYVPLDEGDTERPMSIDGGPDGLKFVPAIIRHAVSLQAELGLTLGSYSSPQQAAALIREAGYQIYRMTLASLPCGEFTLHHPGAVLRLEQTGRAILWRAKDGRLGYLIVGMACRRTASAAAGFSPADVATILKVACSSKTRDLECLEPGAIPGSDQLLVRVLVLPDPAARRHW